ncbi:MAG TPA: hypothetical protein VMV83_05570 [Rectinemataceae bacterium]|nr:hypothetical protein [Rectinemataceae bacterium]
MTLADPAGHSTVALAAAESVPDSRIALSREIDVGPSAIQVRPGTAATPSGTELSFRVPSARQRNAESTISLAVEREGIFAFEAFLDSIDFASEAERSRLKLAGSEIFDNLVKHASPLAGGMATLRVARRGGILYLIFGFKSPTFGDYATRCYDYEPIFDHRARRWRGMGLRMTRNLSSDLRFRAGSMLDRVIIRF